MKQLCIETIHFGHVDAAILDQVEKRSHDLLRKNCNRADAFDELWLLQIKKDALKQLVALVESVKLDKVVI